MCSLSDEQESGAGWVHLMREHVLVSQVDSTPDQLAPQTIEKSATEMPQKNMREGKTTCCTYAGMHLLWRILQSSLVVVPLLLQQSLVLNRHCAGTGQRHHCSNNGILQT